MISLFRFFSSLIFSSAVTWAYWDKLKGKETRFMFFCGQLSIGMSLSEMFFGYN